MLTAGSRLGPYEILSSLGVGGMGEVYRARDTRLGRTVAIKVLASQVSESPERRQRFEREARAVSSLSHPHIAALYDIGSEDGTDFLVMECVEGSTLAERLNQGALPIDEALRYGAQIADALDKAHRQGIVHRDLKPSNLMLTKSGVKVLDFGLAKLEERESGVVLDSSAPTEAKALTREGTILGTLQYMAPEQLEGKNVDARADLFALGAILYEMVTGRPAFQGESPASLIAAILDHHPQPVSELEPTASPLLDHAIGRCLEKDPEERWRSAFDLERELEWTATAAPTPVSGAPLTSRKRAWLVPAILAAVAVVASFLGGVASVRNASSPDRAIRAAVPLGDHPLAGLEAFPTIAAPAVAISPDGQQIVYVGERNGTLGIYLRAVDEPEARWVAGTEGGHRPFFSPDGQWLGFVSDRLWKIPVAGGAPVSLTDRGDIRGAHWGPDGFVYFTPSQSAGVWRVPDSGGEAEELTAPEVEAREKTHRFPEVLPNGQGVLFTLGDADMESFSDARIAVLVLDTGERRVLVEGGMNPRYLSTGHILYAHGGSLLAVPFDAERLEVTGPPLPVVDGVTTSPHFGSGHFAVSSEGTLVFVPGGARLPEHRLVWVDRNGNAEPLPGAQPNLSHPRIAPDGRRVAASVDPANVSIWIHEISRGIWTPLVEGWNNMMPIWEPDGRHLTFRSTRTGPSHLFRQAVDGSGPVERLTGGRSQFPGSWSPDGSILAFVQERDLWALPVQDGTDPYPLLETRAQERTPEISPDGRWLAYVSDASGQWEVYVQPFPEPGPRVQVSTDGGTEPAWAPSGDELFYLEGDRMMVVDIEPGEALRPSRPRLLFESSQYAGGTTPSSRDYDVAPDGQRFLMIEEIEPEPLPDHLTLIVNWFAELESRFAAP